MLMSHGGLRVNQIVKDWLMRQQVHDWFEAFAMLRTRTKFCKCFGVTCCAISLVGSKAIGRKFFVGFAHDAVTRDFCYDGSCRDGK